VKRKERVRRVSILCCKFARYLAHYRAGWVDGKSVFKGQLWTSVNNACLDQCVLGWCELFADDGAKYHWRRIVDKPKQFASELLAEVRMTPDQFGAYCDTMRRYRDKLVLDSEKIPHIPDLAPADAAVLLFYRRIREEHKGQALDGLPPDITNYYRVSAEDATTALYR
jgi:hypothetical protein